MDINSIAKSCGAQFIAPVKMEDIKIYPELREMCAMNSCGHYNKNWGCPPACGEIEELSQRIHSYENAMVYQLVTPIEDSFDIEGMGRAGENFSNITLNLKKAIEHEIVNFWVIGAGGCHHCGTCTYPEDPCRQPRYRNISVEACGVNVSQLCDACGLKYINGKNTVTNTGLILY